MTPPRGPAPPRPIARHLTARRVVPVLVLTALVAVACAAPARAGTFRFAPCGAAAGIQPGLWSVEGGWAEGCADGIGTLSIRTPGDRLAEGGSVTVRLDLPDWLPGASIRGASLDWRFNSPSPGANPAHLAVHAAGEVLLFARTGEESRPGSPTLLMLPGVRRLEASMWCPPRGDGAGWCGWPGSLLDLRGITLELEEHNEPWVVAGPLMAAAPHSGVERVAVTAVDADSGISAITADLDGTRAGALRPEGGCSDDRLPPCPMALRGALGVDTRAVADGRHGLRIVASDAAGNTRAVLVSTIEIRNAPPPAPPIPPEPESPAPARAPLFPENPLAGRGHAPNGATADSRARLDVWLEPPRRRGQPPVKRRTVTVPPGARVRIRGRLTDRRGRGIARAALAAIRRADGGPWQAITGVRTRPDGRFTTFTYLGPSQEIQFVYYAFGDSRTGRRSPRLRVRVRRE